MQLLVCSFTTHEHSPQMEIHDNPRFLGNINKPYSMEINNSAIDILDSSAKRWYREMVRGARPTFSCAASWGRDLNNDNLLQENLWNDIFLLPFKSSRETKLQSFGFKLLNRLMPCGKYLHKIKVRDDPCCPQCGEEDDIVHFFFFSCPTAKTFWTKLSDWCELHLNLSLAVSRRIERKNLTNGLLLTAKFFIQKRRLFYKADLSLLAFLAETRSRLITERTVCAMTNRQRAFRDWSSLLNILS